MRGGRKLLQSFRRAAAGILSVIRSERNIRIHLSFLCYVLFFAWYGQVPARQIPILFLCFGMVLSAELFNSAIEHFCDAAHPEYDPTVKTIKDIASGAVLLTAIAAAIAGLWIFCAPSVLLTVLSKFLESPYIAVLLGLSLIPIFLFCKGKKR